MTEKQKEHVAVLRKAGYVISEIAKKLSLPRDTVKSHCKRNNIIAEAQQLKNEHIDTTCFCRACGKVINQTPGHRHAVFCSSECRVKWWNSHPERVNRKAIYHFTCEYCKKEFTAYGNAGRKYCSHECYINDRFKGGDKYD